MTDVQIKRLSDLRNEANQRALTDAEKAEVKTLENSQNPADRAENVEVSNPKV